MNISQFFDKGWCRFKYDKTLMQWIDHALPSAREAVAALHNAKWLRCGGTWFVGVNAMPNAADGSVNGSGAIRGEVINFIRESISKDNFDWDQAQVSVCYPGYPQPMPDETAAAFAYRRDRDAAHADGLLPEGPKRRRHLREYHGFILGIPTVDFSSSASPLVVWEGSHEIMRETFIQVYQGLVADQWGKIDITEVYHEARRNIFERCKRIEIYARPGETYLVHRLTLHGISPWQNAASTTPDGRMIVYFRPEIGGPEDWLFNP